MASKAESGPVYEERFEEMVTPSDVKTTLRLARFLNPLFKQYPNQATNFPPLLSEIFPHDLQQWPSKVIFRGWYGPMVKWKQWVHQLSPKYSPIWTQAGIHQAIMTSVCEVKSNPDTVLGLSEFWCPDTNTFLFPWGEATITLEDVMILGGYPVLGDPVTSPIHTEELAQIEEKFNSYRLKILRNKGIKTTHHGWLNYFSEQKKESRGDHVHVAFLSIWLSRYVFPSAGKSIVKWIIPIAVKLSQGIKLALGPAVLASLYHNLTFLREQAFVSSPKINVSGPFHLLQIWAFERFPIIGPVSANFPRPGEPRMARWDKLILKLNLPLVRLAVKEAKNFQWRPYVAQLKNWHHPSYYKENEQLYSDCSRLDEALRSFYRFLLVSELVGMDCKEKYFPHRVAMQFGLDQDVPAYLSNMNFSTSEPVKLFVPSRSFQPAVSLGYSSWWKGLMLAREGKIKEVLLGKDRDRKNSDHGLSLIQANGRSQGCHATVASVYQIDPESQASTDSSFEIPHHEVFPEVPFKGKRSASNDNAVRGDWDEPVVRRNQADFCTTPENLKRSSSTVTPPPGFQKSSSNAKKRLVHESSNSDVHESASLPCAKNAKVPRMGKELPMSSWAKTCQDGIPDNTSLLNLVKREDSSDDDVVIISHFDKKEASLHLQEASNQSQNAASSSTIGAGSGSKRERLSTGESLEVPKMLKKFNASSEVNAEAKIADIRPAVNKASKEVVGDVCKFATKETAFPREVKVEAGDATSEPFNVADVKTGIASIKEVGISVKIPVKGGASKLAGESPSNPINLDEDTASPSSKCQKQEQYIEKRIQKLEKLLGIV